MECVDFVVKVMFCGSFSYAEIPKQFDVILLIIILGTLRTLSPATQNIINDTYGIARHTYMSSIVGSNKLKWDERQDIELYDESVYHENLKQHIAKKINDGGAKNPRCVFLSFDTKRTLEDFYKSEPFKEFKEDTLLLTEEK